MISRIALNLLGSACLLAVVPAMAGDSFAIVNAGQSARYWTPASGHDKPVAVPDTFAAGDQVCLAVGYAIGKDGQTTSIKPLKQSSSVPPSKQNGHYWDAYYKSAVAAVSGWRFNPADTAKVQPVYTVAYFSYDGSQPGPDCAINDLPRFMTQTRNEEEGDRRLRQMIDHQNQIESTRRGVQQELIQANRKI